MQNAPLAGFFREALAELKKVHWPTREQTTQMTIIVIAFSLATGIILGGLDFVFAQLVAFLVGAR
jgi:preprotein translocase subunit SecE